MTAPAPAPDPGPDYLAEAADQLRLARADNEQMASYAWVRDSMDLWSQVTDRRVRIAEGLIAVDAARRADREPGGHVVRVALERLPPRYAVIEDGEPGS